MRKLIKRETKISDGEGGGGRGMIMCFLYSAAVALRIIIKKKYYKKSRFAEQII